MALALRGAATLKPEIRLAQALSEYEAILNDDEKASFRKLRAGKPPIPSDVMKLTANIDRVNSQRWGRRCVGPRLTSILDSVQQFTTIADFIIGGSQCLIASAIWGTLKTTLQLAVGFSSFFDDLTALYMQVGRTAPRFQEYGALYSGVPRLQQALCEYFCVVVGICRKAVLFIRRRFAAQLSTAVLKPFKTEFGPLVKQLTGFADVIREEASLASKQELQLERHDASAFRAMFSSKATQEVQAARIRRSYKMQLRFLDACSTFDNQAPWRRARKAGTSNWILAENAYKQWVEESASSVLWCTGKLGCGKTVSTASLVQETIIRYPEAFVAHFFCSHDNSESLKAKTVVGTLVRQLLNYVDPQSFDGIDSHDLSALDEEAMLAHLGRLTSAAGRQMFVFVDGLDECEDVELKILLKYLDEMVQSQRRLHVFCSSRPDVAAKYQALLRPGYKICSPEENPEVAHYIDAALEDCLQSGSLSLGNPALIITIREKLLQGCQGMFLWVVFQIEALCIESTDDAILRALDSLPKSLPETFERILKRLDQAKITDSAMRRKIFALITAAKRPLNTDELREAVSVTPGEVTWDPNKQVNDIQKAVTSCGSLLLMDEEDMTVRFAHHSVRQYVISAIEDAISAQYLASSSEANLIMGRICVTYLNLGVFDTKLTKFTGQKPLVTKDITRSVMENTLSTGSIRNMALRLLRNRSTTNMNLTPGLQAEMRSSHEENRQEHPFLAYARDFWLAHTATIDDKASTYHAWHQLLDGQVSIVKPPWSPDHWRQLPRRFLDWTIDHEHEALIWEIVQRLETKKFPATSQLLLEIFTKKSKSKVFQRADSPHPSCYLLKLSKSSDTWKLVAAAMKWQEILCHYDGLSLSGPILWPIKTRNQVSSFDALLEYSSNNRMLYLTDRRIFLLLTAVAEDWGKVTTVLSEDILSFFESGDSKRRISQALLRAVKYEQPDIVSIILTHFNADVNERDPDGSTALCLAAQSNSRSAAVVLPLLPAQRDIEVNRTDSQSLTPLHHAVAYGSSEAVTLLLASNGIHPTLRDETGRTAADLARRNPSISPELQKTLNKLCNT